MSTKGPARLAHAAHVAGREAACRRGIDVHRVVVEEEHPVGRSGQPGRDRREDVRVRFDQAELEGQEAELEGANEGKVPEVCIPLERVRVAEAPDASGSTGLRHQLGRARERPVHPGPERGQELRRRHGQLPVGHHAGGEGMGRAAPRLELLDPPAAQPACPELLVGLDAAQFPHRGHATDLEEDAPQVEQDDLDGRLDWVLAGHSCEASAHENLDDAELRRRPRAVGQAGRRAREGGPGRRVGGRGVQLRRADVHGLPGRQDRTPRDRQRHTAHL